jgi:hypothetical protein
MADPNRGLWLCTHSGVSFYPADSRPEDVRIEDIAHALSHLCRFAGHTRTFYSVAEHSVYAAAHARELGATKTQALAVLMHDAAEAYVIDLPRPVKMMLPEYKVIEQKVEAAIRARFGIVIDAETEALIHRCDEVMLATEKRDLMPANGEPWPWLPDPLTYKIRPRAPENARMDFMMWFGMLGGVS